MAVLVSQEVTDGTEISIRVGCYAYQGFQVPAGTTITSVEVYAKRSTSHSCTVHCQLLNMKLQAVVSIYVDPAA